MAPTTVELGSTGLKVSSIGYGAMGLTAFYNQKDSNLKCTGTTDEQGLEVLRACVASGVNFVDTAQVYIRHNPDTDTVEFNESLVGKALKELGRDKFVVATKTGIRLDPKTFSMSVDGTPEFIRQSVDESRARLGVECIDLYYLHRISQDTPIEVSMRTLKELVQEGKIRHVGLSEASAATIRRANSVHPLACVQVEWSLWTRDIEAEIVPCCKELAIGVVAYSPLGRGLLTGAIKKQEDLPANDWRSTTPRFGGDALGKNVSLVEGLEAVAARKGCSPGQLALAWVAAKGRQLGLKGCVPIPGTCKVGRLEENVKSADITLTDEEIAACEAAVPVAAVVGDRYGPGMGTHSTDNNPPLVGNL